MLTHILQETVRIFKNHDSGNTFVNRGFRCECDSRHFERTGITVNMGPNRPACEWELTCVYCGTKHDIAEPWTCEVENWGGQDE